MKLSGNNLKTFVTFTSILADMDKDVTVLFNTDKIIIKILSSNVAMGLFEISAGFFDSYDVKENTICTLDTRLFNNIVKKLGKKDLEIEILEASIKFSSGGSSFGLKYFVGVEIQQLFPVRECDCVWVVPSDSLATLIEEHLTFSDYCKFVSSDILKTYIKSNLVDGEVIAEAKCIKTVHDEETGNAIEQGSSYDIRYLLIVTKIKDMFKDVVFKFSDNFPCFVSASVDNFKFDWVLAPRVENQ